MKKILGLLLAGSLCFMSACGSSSSSEEEQTEIEVFSNKVENTDTYQKMIQKFEQENPDIDVKLSSPPEAETILRTRLVKNDLPDVLAVSGSSLYGELADAGLLKNYQDSPLLNNIQPAYVNMLEELEAPETSGIHGVPYAANANAVIYNKDKMEQLGEEPPKTWDEFIALLQKAEEENMVPIYFTLQDAWTGMVTWNAIAGNMQPENFAQKKKNGNASFEQDYEQTAEKTNELLNYGHDRMYGVGYEDGNRAFAEGEGLLYIQGNWAIPEILKVNPEANLGVFPLPVYNQAEKNELVSGVDVLFSALKETEHPKAADKFISFIREEEQSEQYMDEQAAFSVQKGIYPGEEYLQGFKPYFDEGRLTSFPDHYYPPSMSAESIVQSFMIERNQKAFLRRMDNEWEKVQRR